MTKEELDKISGAIVDTAIALHRRVGPGLVESIYEVLMARDFRKKVLPFKRQCWVSATIDGVYFHKAFRPDIVVAGAIVVEIKSVKKLDFAQERQLNTYLRAMGLHVGLLLNFGAPLMKDGIRRVVHRI